MADSKEEEKRSLEEALQREIVQCYVLEGHYPDSLSYLEEQYGFSYDKEHFLWTTSCLEQTLCRM